MTRYLAIAMGSDVRLILVFSALLSVCAGECKAGETVLEKLTLQPSLDQRALDYVSEDMNRSQGPAAEYLDYARRTLDEQVDYYGKPTSRTDVLKDKEKYVARWPVRSYRVQSDSVRTVCDPDTSRCQIAGLVDFDLSDPAKNRKTQGTSTFEFGIRFGPDGPKLFHEQGKVLPAQH
jgi:hypothetical protein